MVKKMRKLSPALVVLVVTWALAAEPSGPATTPECSGHAEQAVFEAGGAPLFDSIDENRNPVSMADMIDGRPLVLAVSSCT